MYHQKYIKYKTKYINLSMNQTGGARQKYILLDGTSSAGKSTIGQVLVNQGYTLSRGDDVNSNNIRIAVQKKMDFNRYYTELEMKNLYEYVIAEMMRNAVVGKDAVYDDITQTIAHQYPEDKIFIIVVYTPLDKLIRNIIGRRETEPRLSVGAFKQFSERYIVTKDEHYAIDSINRKIFLGQLEEKLKYLFVSYDALQKFVYDIFEKMGIRDDDDHLIKLRDEYKCDYLLKVENKTPEEISNELILFTN